MRLNGISYVSESWQQRTGSAHQHAYLWTSSVGRLSRQKYEGGRHGATVKSSVPKRHSRLYFFNTPKRERLWDTSSRMFISRLVSDRTNEVVGTWIHTVTLGGATATDGTKKSRALSRAI